MAKRNSTKEKYIIEALKLFAERGFDAVKLSEIAERVGVVPSALYKHFQNKEQLYEAILEKSINEFAESGRQMKLDFNIHSEETKSYFENTEETLITSTKMLFEHTLHTEEAKAFRKLMMIEQFHLKDLAEQYDKRYIYEQYARFEALFKGLMQAGKMKQGDAYNLAVMYISPIIVMIGLVDRNPEKEEWAWNVIEGTIRQFCREHLV